MYKISLILLTKLVLTILSLNVITNSMAAEESPKKYTVNVDFVFLHTEIPIDETGKYLVAQENDPEKNKIRRLKENEVVVEMPRDPNGHYQNHACKKSVQFGFQVDYDWSLVRDWVCVAVESNQIAQSPSASASGDSKASLIFYTQDFPPYSYGTNKPQGPGVDLVEKACKVANLNCNDIRLTTNWAEAQNEVKSGQAQGLFFINIGNDKSRDYLTLSQPLVEGEYGFFVRSDENWRFNSIKDLQGKTVGAYGPSATYDSLTGLLDAVKRENIQFTIKEFSDTQKVLTWLIEETKETRIAYSNQQVAESIANNWLKSSISYAGKHRRFDYYIGVKKGHELSQRFLETLGQLSKEEIRQSLANYSEKLEPSEQRPVGWVYKWLLKEKGGNPSTSANLQGPE